MALIYHRKNNASKKNLFLVMLSIFLASVAYGLLLVFISIRLEHNIKNTFFISLSAIFQIGAGVIFAQFLPRFAKKVGLVKSIIISTSITCIASLCLYKFICYICQNKSQTP